MGISSFLKNLFGKAKETVDDVSQKAEVILATDRTENAYKLMIIMEYLVNKDTGASEWYVDECLPFRKRIVAESIL